MDILGFFVELIIGLFLLVMALCTIAHPFMEAYYKILKKREETNKDN